MSRWGMGEALTPSGRSSRGTWLAGHPGHCHSGDQWAHVQPVPSSRWYLHDTHAPVWFQRTRSWGWEEGPGPWPPDSGQPGKAPWLPHTRTHLLPPEAQLWWEHRPPRIRVPWRKNQTLLFGVGRSRGPSLPRPGPGQGQRHCGVGARGCADSSTRVACLALHRARRRSGRASTRGTNRTL